MKKYIILISLFIYLPTPICTASDKSLKGKIDDLRKQLKAHAESETNSWKLIENLKKRINKLENRLSSFPVSSRSMEYTSHEEKSQIKKPKREKPFEMHKQPSSSVSIKDRPYSNNSNHSYRKRGRKSRKPYSTQSKKARQKSHIRNKSFEVPKQPTLHMKDYPYSNNANHSYRKRGRKSRQTYLTPNKKSRRKSRLRK